MFTNQSRSAAREGWTLPRDIILPITMGVIALVGLYLSRQYSYLLFHSLVEMFSVVVSVSIFMLFWSARRFLDNGYFLFMGIAYLFIGGLDLVHTLAYKGMGVFPGYGANLPTQLWIAARYLESLSLLAAPVFIQRKLSPTPVLAGYGAVTALLAGVHLLLGDLPRLLRRGRRVDAVQENQRIRHLPAPPGLHHPVISETGGI